MGASNPPWKKFERELARDVGVERNPCDGSREQADFDDAMFRYSAKRRKDCLPKEVLDWLDRAQLAAVAEGKGRVPVVVIQRRGFNRGEAVVLLRWADWRELHGAARPIKKDEAVHEGEYGEPRSTGGQRV